MSTFVAFAGNLTDDPELLYTREGKPFVSCRVLVNRRVQNDAGEWVDDEPTPRNVKVYGTADPSLHDSAGRGDASSSRAWRRPRAGPTRRPARRAPRTSWSSTTGSARSAARSGTPRPGSSATSPPPPRPAESEPGHGSRRPVTRRAARRGAPRARVPAFLDYDALSRRSRWPQAATSSRFRGRSAIRPRR